VNSTVVARILIVEPHADIRSLLELVINRLGHEPVVYNGGSEEPMNVDAAVIEPGEGPGISVARQLRPRGVEVVFISIFPPESEVLDLKPSAYLVKPFPLYALENALTDALEGVAGRAATV
jgi:DNA-binding response OmpR family regulator